MLVSISKHTIKDTYIYIQEMHLVKTPVAILSAMCQKILQSTPCLCSVCNVGMGGGWGNDLDDDGTEVITMARIVVQ